LLNRLVDDWRFSLADLVVVLLCGAIGMYSPEAGLWCIPIVLLPWILRLGIGAMPFKKTRFDSWIFIFFMTAVAGYFSAYNQTAAFQKFYFILLAILFYYALTNQPYINRERVAWLFFTIGVGISLYFLFTHDFVSNPRDIDVVNRIGIWWMHVRPPLWWPPIPSGHVPGLAVITSSLVIYQLFGQNKGTGSFLKAISLIGIAVILLATIMTTSTSIWIALFGAAGIWLLWKIIEYVRLNRFGRNIFPISLLLCLGIGIVLLYTLGSAPSANPGDFGANDRLEVFTRSLYLLRDFPLWGGGLASFPGLYSQYILGIPYKFFQDSYNLFLDVSIEQGLVGGIAFFTIYLAGIIHAAQKIQNGDVRPQTWTSLFLLAFVTVHGMMQDYLYNSIGIIFLFLPMGISALLLDETAPGGIPVQTNSGAPLMSNRKIRAAIVTLLLLIGAPFYGKQLASIWYANLGAVQLSQAELAGFPESGWLGQEIVPRLQNADASLQTSLQLDPQNLTANYRLGLINMLRRDFRTAAHYLETAYALAPNHRGVIKSLGYCYVWLGENKSAYALLAKIPEAGSELDAYSWWWEKQGRSDLSKQADEMRQELNSILLQP